MKKHRLIFLIAAVILLFGIVRVFSQGLPPQADKANTTTSVNNTSIKPADTLIDIKRLDTPEQLYSFELRNADVGDLFKIMAHDYKLNLLVDNGVHGNITVSFSNVTMEEALNSITDSQNMILEKKGSITTVKPNYITKTFVLKHIEAGQLINPTSSIEASATSSTAPAGPAGPESPGAGPAPTSPASPGSTGSATASSDSAMAKKVPSTIYDLLSSSGKVLLGKQPNSLTVIDYPPNIKQVEDYLAVIDLKMAMKVFKLKYLKATDVVGAVTNTTQASAGAGASGSSNSTSTSSSGN